MGLFTCTLYSFSMVRVIYTSFYIAHNSGFAMILFVCFFFLTSSAQNRKFAIKIKYLRKPPLHSPVEMLILGLIKASDLAMEEAMKSRNSVDLARWCCM